MKNRVASHSKVARNKRSSALFLTALWSAMGTFCVASCAFSSPILGADLATFAVLGASGVTNVPTSIIGGHVGSAPNASIGGGYIFTSGSLQANTATAQQAQRDLDAAILTLSAFGVGTTISDGNLDAWQSANGGKVAPGTYTVSAANANLTGNLILDGGASNSAVWVFQFPSTLSTSTSSNVVVQNVGDGAKVGVYWNVHSAATLNGSSFAGNVLAHELISSNGGLAIACGRLLSATSQVTLNQDSISITGCNGSSGGYDQGAAIGTGGTTVPEPDALALLACGFAALTLARRQQSMSASSASQRS